MELIRMSNLFKMGCWEAERSTYMYGEEFRPDQMSINRTLEAVWMMPLLNPNRNEINCKRVVVMCRDWR